jgi:PPOX class probable F420-dependent enzyme
MIEVRTKPSRCGEQMEPATRRERVALARVARLATVGPDGAPHLVPCCHALLGDVVYTAVDDVKPKGSLVLQRLENLRVEPRAAVLVDHYDDDWSTLWWIRGDGSARLLDTGAERERAIDVLAEKYEQYTEARPPGTVIALDIVRWSAWP